jgi:hypothetical protein
MSAGRSRDPGKERFWRSHLKRWLTSDLSIRAYCRRHHLAEQSFYAWRRTLAQRDAAVAKVPAPPLTFVPLHLTPEPTPATPSLEVVLGNGRRLFVGPGFDAASLRTLLAVLEERPCSP